MAGIIDTVITGIAPYRIIFITLAFLCLIRFVVDMAGSMRRKKESKSVLLTFGPDGSRIQNTYRMPAARLIAEAVAAVVMAVIFFALCQNQGGIA